METEVVEQAPVEAPPVVVDPAVADLEAYRKGESEPEPVAPAEPAAPVEPAEPDPASEAGKELANRKKSLQARIDEATAREKAAERRAQALEQELARYRQPEAPKVEAPAAAKPVVADFETYEEYLDARDEWTYKQRRAAEQQEVEQQRQTQLQAAQQADLQQKAASWSERMTAFAAVSPAFTEKAIPFLQHVNPGTPLGDVLLESPVGPQMALHLVEHPEILERLNRLSPITVLRELGKLEAKLEGALEAPAAPPAPVVTKAPAPVRPIGGAPAAGEPDPAKMNSVSEWMKHRKAFGG